MQQIQSNVFIWIICHENESENMTDGGFDTLMYPVSCKFKSSDGIYSRIVED